MRASRSFRFHHCVAFLALLSISLPGVARASAAESTINSRIAVVQGLRLHYLMAGHGPAVILLHGYTQTSRMWRSIIPMLVEKFTVIAPDLPGIGDSEIPADGLDMKTAAIRIHALAKSLGVEKAGVVGHDIGLMVAYAYAAQFPAEVEKLVVMDAFLPGVAGWENVYNNPGIWHFRFNGPTPFSRQRKILRNFRTKLTMPVLAIGGDKANGELLGQQMKIVASDATMVVLKATGHWVLEEKPKETTDALIKFL